MVNKAIVVGSRTGQRLPKGEIGVIRYLDLNDNHLTQVKPEMLGYETDDGVHVLGTTPKTCQFTLLCSESDLLQANNKPTIHSHPCSTVADRMILSDKC